MHDKQSALIINVARLAKYMKKSRQYAFPIILLKTL